MKIGNSYWEYHDIKLSMLDHYGYKCFYCGKELTFALTTMDHRIPLSRGGDNEQHNLVPACRPCNESKDSLMPWEYQPLALLTLTAEEVEKLKSESKLQ